MKQMRKTGFYLFFCASKALWPWPSPFITLVLVSTGDWERSLKDDIQTRFESMSFVVNILACKLKIVNNRN